MVVNCTPELPDVAKFPLRPLHCTHVLMGVNMVGIRCLRNIVFFKNQDIFIMKS
jgi:hypothetical protein